MVVFYVKYSNSPPLMQLSLIMILINSNIRCVSFKRVLEGVLYLLWISLEPTELIKV